MAEVAIGAIIAIGGAAYSNKKADERADAAQDAQKELADRQTKIRASQAARDRRKTIAAARVERARVENMAGAQGQSGSSAAIAGAGSASAQAAVNIGEINTSVANMKTLEAAEQRVVTAGNKRASLGESIASNIGASFGNNLVNKSSEKLFENW